MTTDRLLKILEPEKIDIPIERFEGRWGLGVRAKAPISNLANHVQFWKKDSETYSFMTWRSGLGYSDLAPENSITNEDKAFAYAEDIVRKYVQENWKN
ncbi:hypothetical protein GOV13_03440 [Candidatus Pacearchaeota archaeon]|nr:hypothetical protein [Candidatus Pacearchaeota archaeon]